MKAEWKEVPAFGIGEPDCRETQFSRDNHLGNGIGGQPLVYNWTVPNTVHENCVMRIRWVAYLCYVFHCMQICFALIYLHLFDIDACHENLYLRIWKSMGMGVGF